MPPSRAIKTGEPPSEIAEYRILRPVGRGRMGRVYLAHDTYLDRLVALKFIASVRPDAQARERFQIEGRALARLVHPNVVTIHRVDQIDGHPYLVAEYVRGQTLAEMQKPVVGATLLRIGIGMARGLAAAHRQGILHRDIKPANVMVGTDGAVKLLDFGLAKLLEVPPETSTSSVDDKPLTAVSSDELEHDDAHLTGAGGFVGTPMYLAPEVLRGAGATRRSDIYSIGAVLYELTTGKTHRPPPSEELSFDDWTNSTPTPLRSHSGLDPRLGSIIDRCLLKEAAKRFASADELRDALEELDADEAIGAIPPGNPYRGLEAFDEKHRALFCGRGGDVRTVINRLRSEPLVVVTGDSGIGKSSLCRAGIIPRIREGALGDGRHYVTVTMVPGAKPLASLAHALAPLFPHDQEALRRDPIAALQRHARELRNDEGLLLFVDQLEELHTLSDPVEAGPFAELLPTLGAATSSIRILATVRGDFFTRLASFPVLGESLPSALHLLRPLSPEAMRESIVGPARRTGVTFESEALVEQLVDTACRTVGGLPLLQFALTALWEARDPTSQRISASALESIGGVAGALAQHANAVVASLSTPEERDAARRIFIHLVSAEGTIVRRSEEQIARNDAARVALEALVHGRLVVARVLEGKTSYELAHEALTRQWDALRGWLHAHRESRRTEQRVELACAEWVRLGRPREALLRDRQLADLGNLSDIELSPLQLEFVDMSRRMTRRRRWERFALYAALPLMVVLALVTAQIKARRDLRKLVATHEREGQTALGEGERVKRNADEQRRRAFARYDEGATLRDDEAQVCREDAEKQWSATLETARKAELLLAKAIREFESGLALDPTETNLRRLIADAHVLRIDLADAFFLYDRKRELLDHLPFYDDDGSRRARLSAPPHLAIESVPPGADVDLECYETDNGRAKPVLLRRLGRTPLADMAIDTGPGSYRLVFHAPGHVKVYAPVLLARDEHLRIDVALPPVESIPQDYVYVPDGRHLYGSDAPESSRALLTNQPLHEVQTPAFLMGRTEVTYAEWIQFLDDVPESERAELLPSADNRQWKVQLTKTASGPWQLSLLLNGERITVLTGERFVIPGRTRRREQEWEKFPVTGISKLDADVYTAWLGRTGRVRGARLCNEREWERAARGADARTYPHGNRLLPQDAAFDETYGRQTTAFGPDEVDAYPNSESPFGILGLTGSIHELTLSTENLNGLIFRGGAWYFDRYTVRIDNRFYGEPNTQDHLSGLRICASFPPKQP